MKRKEFREAFVASMEELHDEGHNWLFVLDIGRRITAQDDDYRRRYQKMNKVLSLVGINRPDEPRKIAYPGRLYSTVVRLEHDGIIESQWQFPGAPDGEHGRRQYRLVEHSAQQEALFQGFLPPVIPV